MTTLQELQQLARTLPKLPKPTGRALSQSLISGLYAAYGQGLGAHGWFQLVEEFAPPGANKPYYRLRPKVNVRQQQSASTRIFVCADEKQSHFTKMLNDALLGGPSYPIVSGLFSIATGFAGAGMGIAITVIETAASMSRSAPRVLARGGDEIWLVEMVGRAVEDNWFAKDQIVLEHLAYIWLVDPFRKETAGKLGVGWVLHESRRKWTLTAH